MSFPEPGKHRLIISEVREFRTISGTGHLLRGGGGGGGLQNGRVACEVLPLRKGGEGEAEQV